jgi:hypothetical protein
VVKLAAVNCASTVRAGAREPSNNFEDIMIIILNKQAEKRFKQILSTPHTPQQKATIERSRGIHAYYKAKWEAEKN